MLALSTIVFIRPIEPVVVISLKEPLSITKLMEPPLSPTWAPDPVLLDLINISVPSVDSIFDFISKVFNTVSFDAKPIPNLGILPEALIVKALTSSVPPAD